MEQEQKEQEYISESEALEDLDDYLASSEADVPRSVAEPAIEITIDTEISQVLNDIGDGMSMSIFKELEGENEAYPDK